jgi:uncharacterized protein DUF1580
MAGNILSEQRLTLTKAAQHLDVHVSTLHRWRLRGIRGIRLETCLIGGIRYTSHEALARFVTATTAAADGIAATASMSDQRLQQIEEAERELAKVGI